MQSIKQYVTGIICQTSHFLTNSFKTLLKSSCFEHASSETEIPSYAARVCRKVAYFIITGHRSLRTQTDRKQHQVRRMLNESKLPTPYKLKMP